MRSPWWLGLDLRVLRQVRGVLRRRELELTLVEHRPSESAAFAPLTLDEPAGPGLAVIAPGLSDAELGLIEHMLGEAALDVSVALRERETAAPPGSNGGGNGHGNGHAHGERRTTYAGIIGSAPVMQEMFSLLDRVAPAESTVLIQGENGTGKELVARAIHQGSPRAAERFVVTNCSAFNDNLLDSELFGHARGSFTGASNDKPGLFEISDMGTFFLDEIGDMSPALQVKVLRVLQDGTFNRVGDTETRKVDVRIIAATNRDLRAMVADGRFREDLYYRINVINVTLPSLRERREDVPVLVDFFLGRQRRGGSKAKQLDAEAASRMLAYPWPGNVRELENEIERLVVLAGDAPIIGAELLSPRIRQYAPVAQPETADDVDSLPAAIEALERRMIGEAMRRHGGNKTRAAEELKVSRRNLIRLVQKYQL